MCQMFSIGERSGLQAGQFSTWTLLLWSHAVVIAAVCGFALSCWNRRHLEGSICYSKTFIYLSAFIVPSKTCTYAPPYHQRCWLLNWKLINAGRSPSSLAPEDTMSVISNKIVQFGVKYCLMRLKSLLVSILLHLKNDPIFHEFGM